MARTRYHHGDLRAALVAAGLAAIAEHGVAALSVADAARRAGVSPAAPYRHFPSREALLAATATAAARELIADLRAVTDDDAGEALARTAAVYVRFLARRRAGFDLVYAAELAGGGETELATAGRELMDLLLPLGVAVTADAAAAMDLLEQLSAVAHGYGALFLTGFLRQRAPDVELLAGRAAATVRTLVAAVRRSS